MQSQILHFRGWSKVRDTARWGLELLCSKLGSQEKGGKDPEGISTLCTQFMWSVLEAGPVQAAISTLGPPDLVQSLPLEGFVWNCSPWEQGALVQNVWESWGAHGGECQWGGSRIFKMVTKGINSPFWAPLGSWWAAKGSPCTLKSVPRDRKGS